MAVNPADLPLLDAFGYAGPALGAGWSGNEWDTTDDGVPTVTGNAMASGGLTFASTYWGTSYNRPLGARCKWNVLPAGTFWLALAKAVNTAAPTGYYLRYDGTDWQLFRLGGGATELAIATVAANPVSAGDEVAITLDTDGTLTGHRFHSGSWSTILTANDTTYTDPLYPAAAIYSGDSTVRVDDYRGGNPSTGTFAPVSVGGATAGGVAPTGRVPVARGAAVGGGNVVLDGAPPAAPSEVQFFQPLDEAAVIRVRRVEEQAVRVAFKAGRITSPPATPTSDGFAVATTTLSDPDEVVAVEVPLPSNDDDYTLAVFGWDGQASTACLLVEVFGAVSPEPLEVGRDYAAATIVTARPARPRLRTAGQVDGGAELDGEVTTYEDPDGTDITGWRLLGPGDDPSDPGAGVALVGAWGSGNDGNIVRRALPAAAADRWHEWANIVTPTP